MSDNESARELFDLSMRQYEALQKRIDGRVGNLWKIRLAAWSLLAGTGSFCLEHSQSVHTPSRIALLVSWLAIGVIHMLFERAQEQRIAFERPRALACLDQAEALLVLCTKDSDVARLPLEGTHASQPAMVPPLRLWSMTYLLAATLTVFLLAG